MNELEHMKLDTAYSPTHEAMAKRFLIPSATEHGLLVRARAMTHRVQGNWNAPGTMEMQLSEAAGKLFLEPCTGELRMMCGVDIIFLQEWPQYCAAYMAERNLQLCFAWDSHVPCLDFVCFFDTLEMRTYLLNLHWKTFCIGQHRTPAGQSHVTFVNNQFVNVELLKAVTFKWGCFPGDVVCNWPNVSGQQEMWTDQPFVVPTSCRAYHANWTIGVESKTAMLERVLARKDSSLATD